MKQSFFTNDIAVISYSCVLPQARSPEQFWKNCIEEKNAVGKVSDERLKNYLVSEVPDAQKDRIYSTLACEISRTDYEYYLEKNNLKAENANRLHAYAFEAVRQVLEKIPKSSLSKKVDLILGCMNPDTEHELQIIQENRKMYLENAVDKFLDGKTEGREELDLLVNKAVDEISKDLNPSEHHFFSTYTLAQVAERFGLNGEQFVVDTACASSLTAIDLAMQRLKLGQTDLALAGGIESNLGHGAYIIFSKVGALATKKSAPMDTTTEGLVQGEGSVIFALKRLEDAINDGDEISGVIRAVAGSSDGRSASLFQPNVNGQVAVYNRVYTDDRNIDYLEAHGTGTQVGDVTEKNSIKEFFSSQKLPVGSVKSLVGHTKGAAGATGLLKALFIIKKRCIPGSGYVTSSVFESNPNEAYVNTSKIDISHDNPIRVGINSFGFGGTNYHLLIEEFRKDSDLVKKEFGNNVKVGVIAESKMSLENFEREDFKKFDFPFRLPPNSLKAIDKVQLLALLASWNCIKDLGHLWNYVPKDKVGVISACTLCLDQIFDMIHRLAYEMIASSAETEKPDHPLPKKLRAYLEENVKPQFAPINEDAATGVLNNVIAGRICNIFDLYGKSYNLDKDTASVAAGLQAIENELRINPDQLFIFIAVEETHDLAEHRTKRHSVTARLITSEQFAFENEMFFKQSFSVSELDRNSNGAQYAL